ncbi:DUF6913 domain-containing protein [Myroides sp. LJL119]
MISNALEKHGILKSNMEFLILNDNKASVQNKSYKFYSLKSFNSMGHCLESQVLEFINKPFDLLVSLYEKNSIALQWATACSKAKCKTGLFYEQESLNHFDIKLNHLQGKEFVDLLFNYLAIFSENDKKTNNQKTITK